MDTVVYREMQPEDIPAVVALRNEAFSEHPITVVDWDTNMLGSLAVLDGEIVGAIPLAMRSLVIAPGTAIRAPFENQVCTRASLRSQGIGSGMIAAARNVMRDRADGLFVYRSAERSRGYQFYRKTGHYDLMATRSYRLSPPASGTLPPDAVVAGVAAICAQADALLPLFRSTYGQFGGYPPRTASYWREALASPIFAALPTDFFLLRVLQDSALVGYAIVGIRTVHADGFARIMEMATRAADLAIAQGLLMLVSCFAAERGLAVEACVSDDDPFVPALRCAGFEAAPRRLFLLGQIIDVPQFFRRYWRQRVSLGGSGLRVWTPEQDYTLCEASMGYPNVTLEMKEETLHRWLLGRVNLACRLREGTVTAYGGSDAILRSLCTAIPPVPWAYHPLDWL